MFCSVYLENTFRDRLVWLKGARDLGTGEWGHMEDAIAIA